MDQGDAPTIVESDERAKDRRASPALYMIWDPGANPAQVTLTPTYQIAAVGSDEVPTMRPVVEIDGALTDSQWNAFVERILPDGMFVARRAASQDVIGTVSAVHNPRGARYYFPAGGQIGYLVVAADHRGQGLGHGLVTAALGRLRAAGYCNIWVAVEESRLPAIVTYLKAGFMPFLHAPEPDALAGRWRAIFRTIGRAVDTGSWRRELLGASNEHAPLSKER